MNSKYFAGIDIGGTNLRFSIIKQISNSIEIVHSSIISHDNHIPNDVFEYIAKRCKELCSSQQIELSAIGLAIAALLNRNRTASLNSPNLGWHNQSLIDIALNYLQKPFFIENDVNAATYGEASLGNGVGHSNVLALTWGTGIGSGLIIENQIVRGHQGVAAELGHTLIDESGPLCGCGRHGCLESYVGGRYLAEKYNLSSPQPLFEEWKKQLNPGFEIIEQCITLIARTLANASALVNPSLILLGGGIIIQNPALINAIEHKLTRLCIPQTEMPIVKCFKFGEYAGSIGAALLARDAL